MLTIQIQIKNVYSNLAAYPANQSAECIAAIARTKTLTRNTLVYLLAMGATIIELDRHGRASREYRASDVSHLPAIA